VEWVGREGMLLEEGRWEKLWAVVRWGLWGGGVRNLVGWVEEGLVVVGSGVKRWVIVSRLRMLCRIRRNRSDTPLVVLSSLVLELLSSLVRLFVVFLVVLEAASFPVAAAGADPSVNGLSGCRCSCSSAVLLPSVASSPSRIRITVSEAVVVTATGLRERLSVGGLYDDIPPRLSDNIRGASISLLLLVLLSSSSSSTVGPVSKQFRRRHRTIDPMIFRITYYYGLIDWFSIAIGFLFEKLTDE